ncbi:MAG: phenylacetate--CoA ligase family protein [Thermodesulfobacteriota bacterium]
MEERTYWNEEMETKPRPEMIKLQEKKILEKIAYVYENSPFHKKLWDERGVKPTDIHSLEDYQNKVPCFNKDDLRIYRNETGDPFCGLLCVPIERCVFASMSTGTTGEATFPIFTKRDIETAIENGARNLWTVGLRPGMKYLYDLPHHPIMASLMYAGERIGALTMNKAVPVPSEFEIERHMMVFKYFRPNVWFILSSPVYSIMNDYFKKRGVNPKELLPSDMVAIYGGEPITRQMRKSIRDEWGIEIFVESGSGDFCWINIECEKHNGLHNPDDLTFIEIVNPETDEPLEPGKRGELAITTMEMEAAPVMRFKMDDIAEIDAERCGCGRTTSRLYYYDRKVNETRIGTKSVFPIEVREILESFSEMKDGVCQIVQYAEKMDILKLRAVYDKSITTDTEGLRKQAENKLDTALGLKAEIELITLKDFSSLSHKFPRVVKEW